MSYSYTITIGVTTFTPSDMEKIIDSSTLKIVKPFCSTKKTSGTGTMSVVAKGAADPVFYQTFMTALLGAQQAQEVNDCQIVVNEDSKAVFRGYLDLSTIQINSAKLPQNLTLSANDKSILLDKKIRMNKAWENQKRSTIISELLAYLDDDYGTPVSLLSDVLPATKKIKRFAVTEAKEQTYRDVIDKVLLESAGYVLWYDPEYDGFRVMAIQTDLTGLTPRVIEYLIKNQLQTKSAIYEKDGVLLSFPNVVERPNTNIYTENISVSIDENNYVTGQDVPSGHYFPSDGDIKEIYQQYRVPDRPYISHESRLQNQDLKLIYCKDVEYSLQSNPKLSIAPALANVKWTGEPEYYPDRARLLFINNNPNKYFPSEDTSALDAKDYYKIEGGDYVLISHHTPADNPKALGWYEAQGANVSAFSITGTAVYESYLNKVTVGRLDPDANGVPCTNPEEYKADTIQYMNGESDFSEAIAFAKWYYKSLNYGQTISQWTEYPGVSYLGEVVYVAHKMTGIMMPHIVVQITDESVDGSRVRCNRVVAISIYGWEEYVYDNGIVADGNNGTQTERANRILTGDILVGTATCRGVAGIVGDIYINDDETSESFGNMYKCIVAGTAFTAIWEYQANIKGKDASVVGLIYEIEYGLSTSDSEFIFPEATYGYDSEHTYGYDSDNSYGFKDYAWSPTLDGWYHGLYVWTRIKITDADGNITYEDPTYAAELTQSLIDSCSIAIESSPITYTNNPRRTDDQYLGLTLKDVGYRGTLVLRTSQGGFAEYNNLTQAYEDIIDPSTGEIANQLEVYFSGTNIVSGYYLKLPYALDEIVYLTGTLTEWTSYQVYTSLTITPATEKTTAIQLDMVNVAAELPQSVNVNNQEQGVAYGDNLIRGDYTLVKYVTLTATTTNSAVDEEGTTHPFTDFGAYYSKNGNEFTKLTISAFVVDTVYYAFRLYPWMYDGEAWHRTNDSAVKTNTVEKVVEETKWQHDNIDSSLDYHDCLVAYDAYIMNLSAAIINAGDIFANNITSNNYEEDTDGAPTKGYKLVHSSPSAPNGEIKSFGGVYTNMNVRGNLNLFNGEEAGAEIKHPALSTNPGTEPDTQGATIPVPSPTTWSSSSLYGDTRLVENYIYEQASGLYNLNKPISKLLRLTNKNATYIQGASESWSQGSTTAKAWSCTLQIPSNIPTSVQVSISGSTGRNVVKTPKARLYIDEVLVQETDYGNSSYSFSVSVSGGQTVKLNLVCYATFYQGGASYYQFRDATCTMSYSSVSFTQLGFNAEGIWLYYNNQWNNKGTNSAVSEPAYLTSPIRWYDSGHYVQPTPFTSYSGGDVTMTPGIPYKIGSQNLMLNNVGIVGKYFTKNTDGTRTLTYTDSNGENQTDLLLSPLNYYYISGRIWIAGTYRGVEMMGCYPVKDAATDPQGGYDCGRSDRQWNTGYFLDVITNGTSITSAREKKNVMGDYIGSALSLLNRTKIVEFSYKVDKTNTPHIGFIADDTPVELSGTKQDSMVVGDCIGVLIKAVQELSQEINRLKGGN